MSQRFVEQRECQLEIQEATIQEKQLSYFTASKLQPDYASTEYLAQWAARKYETSDYFLNFVKSIFKTENFLTFFKYLRFPLPSAKIINNRIVPDLQRVFEAEDGCFDYDVAGIDNSAFTPELEPEKFNKDVFQALLHCHNSVMITDLKPNQVNMPFRSIIPIHNVVSIDVDGDEIEKIAFRAERYNALGIEEHGYLYIDEKEYIFYSENYQVLAQQSHDLGRCPAHFIAARGFAGKKVVRESIFTYIREELEEYNFLKTLQKMTEPNGAIPITTYLKSSEKKQPESFVSRDGEPGGSEAMASQRPSANAQGNVVPGSQGNLQTGTSIGVPAITKEDGSLDMEAVKSYLNFFYIPVESLEYIKLRVQELERSIVTTIVGDVTESRERPKNELQIRKSVLVLENTLRRLSADLSRIRTLADMDFLGLKYGNQRVNEVTAFYGSDFFLQSQEELFADFQQAPNPIERKNILIRIAENKYRNNPEKLTRQVILNCLLPYTCDTDFDKAIAKGNVDPIVFDLQNRFNYWIQQFESEYGDIVAFFNGMGEIGEAEKYRVINNLLVKLIPVPEPPPPPPPVIPAGEPVLPGAEKVPIIYSPDSN